MDINGYLNLIPTENSRAPKFMEFLEKVLNPVMDLHNIIQHSNAFNVNEAAGDQLDVIGSVVGVDRELPFTPISGETLLTDDEYRLAIQLRIAQEAWNGTNEDAADIYARVVSDYFNIDYEDEMDCSLTINVDLSAQEIAQALDSVSEYMVPAGVEANVDVNDAPGDVHRYFGIAVTGIEYIDEMELVRGDD